MSVLLKIDVLVFSILLLIILLVGMSVQKKGFACSEQIFYALNISMIFVISLDLIALLADGHPGRIFFVTNYVSNTVLSVLQPLPTVLWLCYIDYHIFKSKERLRKRGLYLFPLLIGLVLSMISLKNGMVFTIDDSNVYHRGIGIYIISGVNILLVFYSWYLVLKGRKNMGSKILSVVIFFTLIPIIGGVIQLLNYGLSLFWPFLTIGTLLIYIVLELHKDTRDYLTGLYNRQQIGDWMEYRIKNYGCSGPFSLVIIDIDNFKEIKGAFGHKSADMALVRMAHSLKKVVKHKDRVARFGDHKFIIVLETEKILAINEVLARLMEEVSKGNRYRETYNIEFSSGYAVYHPSYYKDILDFFEAAASMLEKTKRSRSRRHHALTPSEKAIPIAIV